MGGPGEAGEQVHASTQVDSTTRNPEDQDSMKGMISRQKSRNVS